MFSSRSLQTDSFVESFEEIADAAGVLSDDLVVTFDGKRVFAGSTPQALEIWAEAELGALMMLH